MTVESQAAEFQASGSQAAESQAVHRGLSVSGRRWVVASGDPAQGRRLAEAVGTSPVVGQILVARGVSNVEEARAFLFGGREVLADPLLLPDMDRAVAHLRRAIEEKQKIWVYGDYDVDGVAATALMQRVLQALGAEVEAYIPSRFDEGYGLNSAALEEAAAAGVQTVVTVDCGVTALEEAARARELGLSLIITDHHEPRPEVPVATAVVNPKLAGSRYPFAGLSGTGVAFKLALALAGESGPDVVWPLLDLVALATVADMVPLQGENRVLVKEGLARLNSAGALPGLVALARIAGLKPGELTEYHLAFALAPRINALGRLGSAREALDLMLALDSVEAEILAARLDQENRRRQAIEVEILKEALVQAQEQVDQGRRVLVLAAEGWHIGVVGIVAARILDRFHRPTLMVGLEGEEGRGSGRSLSGFHLYAALSRCEDLLTRFGGHSQAAGFSLRADRLAELAARLEDIAAEELQATDLQPELRLDAEVAPEDITEAAARDIARLAPFGLGNPAPLLALRDATVVEARRVGKDSKHLKLRLRAGGRILDGIAFSLAEAAVAAGVAAGHPVDLAGLPELNEWNGRVRVQFRVRDLGQPLVADAPAARDVPAGRGAGSSAAATNLARPATANPARLATANPALASVLAEPDPRAVPAGAHLLWSQSLPRLAGSGEWSPWESDDAASGGERAPAQLAPGAPPAPGMDPLGPPPAADRRGQDPVAILLDLAGRGVTAIAVAATPARAMGLAAAAAQRQPHLAASFLPYHSRLPAPVRAIALTEFRQRNAPVLLTGWGGLGGLEPGQAEAVVLLDPPVSRSDYQQACALGTGQGPVWQWSEEGILATEALVSAHCPERSELAALYLHLRDLVRSGRAISEGTARESDLPGVTVRVGLQILAELGLLAPIGEASAGGARAASPFPGGAAPAAGGWTWLPVGKGRLALEASALFLSRQGRKQEFLELLGYLFKVGSAARNARTI